MNDRVDAESNAVAPQINHLAFDATWREACSWRSINPKQSAQQTWDGLIRYIRISQSSLQEQRHNRDRHWFPKIKVLIDR